MYLNLKHNFAEDVIYEQACFEDYTLNHESWDFEMKNTR